MHSMSHTGKKKSIENSAANTTIQFDQLLFIFAERNVGKAGQKVIVFLKSKRCTNSAIRCVNNEKKNFVQKRKR